MVQAGEGAELGEPLRPSENALAIVRVQAHSLPLALVKRSGFAPDARGDADAAQVVEQAGAPHRDKVSIRQARATRCLDRKGSDAS